MLINMGPFLFLLILISCGEKQSIRIGESTKADIVQLKGEPLKTVAVPSGEVLTYKDNEKFQITDNKLAGTFRDPVGDEKNVLFWRHTFRDCDTSEKALSQETIPEIELACAKKGQSVVFLKGSGKILRISEYERN
jgi:hypothetical protein